jgi:hypothetical protein
MVAPAKLPVKLVPFVIALRRPCEVCVADSDQVIPPTYYVGNRGLMRVSIGPKTLQLSTPTKRATSAVEGPRGFHINVNC